MVSNNICYKFGIPHSGDLQKLQELCLDIIHTNTNTQNLLIFIGFNLFIFFLLIYFAKAITPNKLYIQAYYKASFHYFIQTSTIIGILPIMLYFLGDTFTITYQIILTISLLTLIYLMYEYWPTIKRNPPAHRGIVSTILTTLFTLNYYFTLQVNFEDEAFSNMALLTILTLYCMVLHIFIRLIKEVRQIQK